MDTDGLHDMWTLMSNYTFEADPISINDDLSCILCHKLMRDACHGSCGCRYCHQCISDYLNEGGHYCPGGKIECNEEMLLLERDVSRIMRINNKVAKLQVLCPIESCQSKMELIQMYEHLRLCGKEPMKCPYVSIGCDNKDDVKLTILAHLKNDKLPHIQLLIDLIHNLKNEVDELKSCVEKNKSEISSLKEESRMKDNQIVEIFDEIAKQKREIENVKKVYRDSENKIVILEEQLRKIEFAKEMWMNSEMEDRVSSQEGEIKEINSTKNDINMEREKMTVVVNNSIKILTESEKYERYRDRTMIRCKKVLSDAKLDFYWICVNKKLGFSESFYSNDYKLCLYVTMYTDKNVALLCYIMKGENDDNLQWPMRHTVTLSVVNKSTLKAYKSEKHQYDTYKNYANKGAQDDKSAFDRPTNDRNDIGIGHWSFISHKYYGDENEFIVTCLLSDP